MPEAGQVVGRISVKILPDTSDFRQKAQKDLDRIEKRLKVEVPTAVDMTGAKRDLLEGIRAINAENASKDSRKIKFRTGISTVGMAAEIKKAVRELQARMKTKSVKVKIKDVEVTGDVVLELDTDSAKKVKDDIDKWRRDNNPVKIDVEFNWQSTSAAAVSARLGILTRPRTVSIFPKIDKGALTAVSTALAALSGARVIRNIFRAFKNGLKDLDQAVPKIGLVTEAIGGLSAWLLTAISNTFALGTSLAQIGPAALLLPGLLGGIAVGIGVMVAALRDFNKELPEVKAMLHGLQDVISANFWDKAAAPMRSMIDELLPEFRSGVEKTATQLGGFFGGLSAGLEGALNPALSQMFKDLSDSINIATGGTGAFANIIAVLGKVGSSYLPELAQWWVNVSKHFSEFLTTAENDGRLKGWIDLAIQNLKDLGSVLSGLGGILKGIGHAAQEAGGSTLGMMADTLHRVSDVVNSADFQVKLVETFRGAHEAMSQIALRSGPAVKALFGQIADLAAEVLPQIGATLGVALGAVADALAQPAVINGFQALLDGIQTAVGQLAPAMAPLGKTLGTLMTVLGPFASMLGGLAAAAIIPLANAFSTLLPYLLPITQALGGALMVAIQTLTPLIQDTLVPVISDLLVGALSILNSILPPLEEIFGQVIKAVQPLVKELGKSLAPLLPVLGDAVGELLTALEPIVDVALQLVNAVVLPLLPPLSELIQKILPPLADAITRILVAIQPILDALLALVNFLVPILIPVLVFVADLFADVLVLAVNAAALTIEGFVEIFTGIWDVIKGVFETWWGVFEGVFTGSWHTFVQGWKDIWDGILSYLKGIWDVILGVLQLAFVATMLDGLGELMDGIALTFRAGWRIVTDLFETTFTKILGKVMGFRTAVRQVIVDIVDIIKALFEAAWDEVVKVAGRYFTSLKTTVNTKLGELAKILQDLPGNIVKWIGSLKDLLVQAGKDLINGFVKGIKSGFGKVKGALGSLTGKLTSWKGPESLDRILLVNAGQLVIDGFIEGLESRYDAVRKSLKGLTSDVAGTAFDSPSLAKAAGLSASLNGSLAGALSGGTTKVLNYYAAPNNSLGSEEDLFAAANRARFGW